MYLTACVGLSFLCPVSEHGFHSPCEVCGQCGLILTSRTPSTLSPLSSYGELFCCSSGIPGTLEPHGTFSVPSTLDHQAAISPHSKGLLW